jgi:hypothetical protein
LPLESTFAPGRRGAERSVSRITARPFSSGYRHPPHIMHSAP